LGKKRKRGHDPAGGLERLALERPGDLHAERGSVAECGDDLPGEVRDIDDDAAESGARERLDLPREKRLPSGDEQRLRRRVGERSHSLAASRGEDHRADFRPARHHVAATGTGARSSSSSISAASGASAAYLAQAPRKYAR